MKKELFLKAALSLLILVGIGLSSIGSAEAATFKGFYFKPGDILVTKSTSSYGLTGHAGIVNGDGKSFTSIAGRNHTAEAHSISYWLYHYPKTKVVRYKYASKAKMAANYAYKNYAIGKYTNRPYRVTSNPKDRTYLYCSEIVWQSYYYGAGVTWKELTSDWNYRVSLIIAPYSYISSANLRYNKFSIVKSFSW